MADGGIGETMLLGEVAPEIGASIPGFVGGNPAVIDALGTALPGMETAGLGSLGQTYGSMSGALGSGAFGTVTPALASAAPEAAAQTTAALTSAGGLGTGTTVGSSLGAGSTVGLAGAPAGTTLGTGAEELIPGVQAGSAMNTPYTLTQVPTPNLPSAMTMEGAGTAADAGGNGIMDWWSKLPMSQKMLYGGAGLLGANALFGQKATVPEKQPYSGPLSKFRYDPNRYTPQAPAQPTPYQPVYQNYRGYAGGGPVEQMANANAIGQNTGYPQSALHQGAYATPWQTPISQNVLSGPADTNVDPYTGEERFAGGGTPQGAYQIPNHMAAIDNYMAQANGGDMATVMAKAKSGDQNAMIALNRLQSTPNQNYAGGGISSLGGYSDGGRMLKGPGDGMSDDIPATIANKQPARLANDEFVVPADVVSHLGNGSSDAGAKQLYKMMDRVRQARTGNKAQGKEINPDKYMPA